MKKGRHTRVGPSTLRAPVREERRRFQESSESTEELHCAATYAARQENQNPQRGHKKTQGRKLTCYIARQTRRLRRSKKAKGPPLETVSPSRISRHRPRPPASRHQVCHRQAKPGKRAEPAAFTRCRWTGPRARLLSPARPRQTGSTLQIPHFPPDPRPAPAMAAEEGGRGGKERPDSAAKPRRALPAVRRKVERPNSEETVGNR